jgi:SH3-like domain-containing protein
MQFLFAGLLALAALLAPVASHAGEHSVKSAEAIRFASLRAKEVNVRAGPGVRYHVKWVFVRKRLPVMITAEFESWRKIRDSQGAEGWVHRAMLSAARTVIVQTKTMTLRRSASEESPAVAQLAPGMVARIERCEAQWCEVSVRAYAGWLRREGLWGLRANEIIE